MLANSPFQESAILFTHFLLRQKHPERLGDKNIPEARAWRQTRPCGLYGRLPAYRMAHMEHGIDSLCVLKIKSEGVWEVRPIHFKVRGTE